MRSGLWARQDGTGDRVDPSWAEVRTTTISLGKADANLEALNRQVATIHQADFRCSRYGLLELKLYGWVDSSHNQFPDRFLCKNKEHTG